MATMGPGFVVGVIKGGLQLAITHRAFVYFDRDTLMITSTGVVTVEAKEEFEFDLPEYTVDLTDDPALFERVRENPGRYRVENGRVVEVEE